MGDGFEGWMKSRDGNKFAIVHTGGASYIKADAAFYTELAGEGGYTGDAAPTFGGRWVEFPPGKDPQTIANITNPISMFDAMLRQHGTLTNLGAREFDGQRAIAIHDSAGGTYYVSRTHPAYLIAAVTDTGVSMSYSDWDLPVTLTAPSGAVDLSAFTG